MPAKIISLLVLIFLLFPTPKVFAQEILLTPPDPGNSPIPKASAGIAFGQGWNFFNLGYNECTTLTVLNELQADGGSALNVNGIFVKEFLNWQSYTFQSVKQKKVGANDLLAFNSNQKFFLQIDEKACSNPDVARQRQIEKVREGATAKNNFLEKVTELPVDLWTKLTNILDREGPVEDNTVANNKQSLDNLTIGGKTTVNDLGITGKITAGLLTINGLASKGETFQSYATIDTLSGDLFLQNEGIGGINILNGKFTIDKNGNVKIRKLNIDEEESSIGGGTIQSGSTSVDIVSNTVTSKSRIFVTATSETGGQAIIVKIKRPGSGFRVVIEKPYSSNISFDWWVVN